jgi:hypothetical protein
MAVEYKKFLAEYQQLESHAASALGERKAVGDSEGNTKKLLDGLRIGIGKRAGEIKAKGPVNGKTKGFELVDFEKDPEVIKYLTEAKTALKNFAAMESRKISNMAAVKALYAKYIDLAKRIDVEIASRKKKVFEPKSLPDMIKLSASVHNEVNATGDEKSQTLKDISALSTPKTGAAVNDFTAKVKLEINKGEAIRASAEEATLVEKFKPRILKLRTDRIGSLGKEVTAAAAAARTAKTAKNMTAAKAQLKVAIDKSIEMGTISGDFSHAYDKNKSFLAQNPDHDTIFKAVSFMTSTTNKALKEVQTLQSEIK